MECLLRTASTGKPKTAHKTYATCEFITAARLQAAMAPAPRQLRRSDPLPAHKPTCPSTPRLTLSLEKTRPISMGWSHLS
jgi:hypothetical protein